MRINPNHLTLAGLLTGIAGAITLHFNYFLAFILILASFSMDVLDGRLARKTRPTRTGAYFDSVSDKTVEASVITSFVILSQSLPWGVLSASLSILISYVKQGSGKKINTVFDRAQRMIFFLIIMLLHSVNKEYSYTLILVFNVFCVIAVAQAFVKKFREISASG